MDAGSVMNSCEKVDVTRRRDTYFFDSSGAEVAIAAWHLVLLFSSSYDLGCLQVSTMDPQSALKHETIVVHSNILTADADIS